MSAVSSTCVIELPSRAGLSSPTGNGAGASSDKPQEARPSGERRLAETRNPARSSAEQIEAGDFGPGDGPVVEAAEKWNEPRINVFRVGAAFWSLMIMGANDSAYGVSIPLCPFGLAQSVVDNTIYRPLYHT